MNTKKTLTEILYDEIEKLSPNRRYEIMPLQCLIIACSHLSDMNVEIEVDRVDTHHFLEAVAKKQDEWARQERAAKAAAKRAEKAARS